MIASEMETWENACALRGGGAHEDKEKAQGKRSAEKRRMHSALIMMTIIRRH
jgi:hypothetical protein